MKIDSTLRRFGVASALAALMLGAAPVALMAETPADTLVVASAIDDIVSSVARMATSSCRIGIGRNRTHAASVSCRLRSSGRQCGCSASGSSCPPGMVSHSCQLLSYC